MSIILTFDRNAFGIVFNARAKQSSIFIDLVFLGHSAFLHLLQHLQPFKRNCSDVFIGRSLSFVSVYDLFQVLPESLVGFLLFLFCSTLTLLLVSRA